MSINFIFLIIICKHTQTLILNYHPFLCHTYIFPRLFRVLLDLPAQLVPLEKMVLVVSVVILVPLVPVESRVLLDPLAQLERRDPLERLDPL